MLCRAYRCDDADYIIAAWLLQETAKAAVRLPAQEGNRRRRLTSSSSAIPRENSVERSRAAASPFLIAWMTRFPLPATPDAARSSASADAITGQNGQEKIDLCRAYRASIHSPRATYRNHRRNAHKARPINSRIDIPRLKPPQRRVGAIDLKGARNRRERRPGGTALSATHQSRCCWRTIQTPPCRQHAVKIDRSRGGDQARRGTRRAKLPAGCLSSLYCGRTALALLRWKRRPTTRRRTVAAVVR